MAEASSSKYRLSPFAKLAGVKVEKSEKGFSRCFIEISEQTYNLQGTAHGGAISTLVDCGVFFALHPLLNKDEAIRTVQLQVNYFTVAASGTLVCESKIINKGKRIATLESEVVNKGKLVAKATGILYINKAKDD